MKIKILKFCTFIIIGLLSINLFSCEASKVVNDQELNSHIVFSSRRWWNYDIFITDVSGVNKTQITKNRWIDFNPSISPDAKNLVFISDRDGNREIYISDLVWLDGYNQWSASNLKNITNSEQNEWTPTFSPLGDRIAYSSYFPENDNYDIFIMNYDGTEKINITNTSVYEKYPQFSPDGTFLIFQSWSRSKMEIMFLNLLERNIVNITSDPSDDILSHGNSFTPDGQSIVFTSNRNGNRDIFTIKPNGLDLKQITSNSSDDYEPIYSPDGESIVFTSERDGNREIYRYSVGSKYLKNISNNSGDDWNPRFLPDGNKIIFQSNRDGNWEIYSMNLDGSNQKNISQHLSTDYSYSIFPLPLQ